MDDGQSDDTAAVRSLFARAGITLVRAYDADEGVMVFVPPQKNVQGRIKKLYTAMNDVRWNILYGVRVGMGDVELQGNSQGVPKELHYYWLTRLEG